MRYRKPQVPSIALLSLTILFGPQCTAASEADPLDSPVGPILLETSTADWFPRSFGHSGEVIVVEVYVGRGMDGRYIVPNRAPNRTGIRSTCRGSVDLTQLVFHTPAGDAPVVPASASHGTASLDASCTAFALFFSLDRASRTRISVINSRGACMARLCDDELDVGEHCVSWDGTDEEGEWVPGDLYHIRIEIDHRNRNRS